MSEISELSEYHLGTVHPREQNEVSPRTGKTIADYAALKTIPARYPARVVGSVIAAAILGLILYSVFTNPRWGWPVFAEYFFSEPVWVGLGRTLWLTVVGTVLGSALGTVLALARVSRSPLLSGLAWGYIWFFRSIPVIVLLLILNNLGYLYGTITLGVPFTGIHFFSYNTTELIGPFTAALLGLSLNQAAFSAEIIRGGILSVDQGQLEASAALGLSRPRQIARIILPQAMRTILPTAFNDIIGLAKGTANVYILALPELFYTIQIIYHRNMEVIPLLMVASVWYLVILTVLSVVQAQVERHYARGASRHHTPAFWQLWRQRWVSRRRTATLAQRALSVLPAIVGGAVDIHRVSKRFGSLQVLHDVSLSVPAGSVTAIIGPSGSGKSTLLRSINHLERVDQGLIALDGQLLGYRQQHNALHELKEKDILKQRVDVGMVFQSFNLFPHLTVLENIIEAPIALRGLTRAQAEAQAFGLLERVGLSYKANAYPRQLSGGQQQRVAIARALALRPKVLLFDEPTSALDPELVNEVLDVIKELARSGATLIIVTHEIGFAREVADNVVFMEQGRIVESGSPDKVLNHPEHARTREFLAKVL